MGYFLNAIDSCLIVDTYNSFAKITGKPLAETNNKIKMHNNGSKECIM